jgi:hypothetical protein
MATSFSGGGSRSTRREPPILSKQLVNFITCGCESSAHFIVHIYNYICGEHLDDHIVSLSAEVWIIETIFSLNSLFQTWKVRATTYVFHGLRFYGIAGGSRSTRREPPILSKQLVNFITCGCESSAHFL